MLLNNVSYYYITKIIPFSETSKFIFIRFKKIIYFFASKYVGGLASSSAIFLASDS